MIQTYKTFWNTNKEKQLWCSCVWRRDLWIKYAGDEIFKKTNSSWKIIGWNWKILRKNIAIILQYINNLQQIADNKICSHQYFIPPLLFFLTCKTALVKNDACHSVCVCVCKPLRVSVCGIFLYLRRLKPPISHPGWWGFYNLSDLPTVDCSEPVTDAHRLL